MKKPTKVALGIPYYGRQDALWWQNIVANVALFPTWGLEFTGVLPHGVSATDRNRNEIARAFLNSGAEYCMWIDADNTIPFGGIKRLLEVDKTMVSGLYYGKGDEHIPIAYAYVDEDKGYRPISGIIQWYRGEILPVDGAGMGALLMHRSVLEDIEKTHTMVQRVGGGIFAIKTEKIRGTLDKAQRNSSDGLVIQGQLRERVIPVQFEDYPFPFFASEFGRTEDFYFFERAKEAGHGVWLDTSVECGHLANKMVSGKDYREARLHERYKSS